MVAAWLVAAVLIIGVGSSLAGEFSADYDTPGSESAAAREITEREFGGYTAQQIYVVWRDAEDERLSSDRCRSTTSIRSCRSTR